MFKLLRIFTFSLFLTCLCFSIASASSIYIVTVNETNIETVQDTAIEIMTGKNFTIDEVTPYKIVFTKSFGDGFWVETTICYVLFNFVERDGNVKLIVSETEKTNLITRKRGIDHLIPIVNQIKSVVDGTPEELISNTAENQLPGSGNQREKTLGIKLSDMMENDGVKVLSVEPGSLAAEKGILASDVLVEVNGRSVNDMTPNGLKSYLANKMASKCSVMLIIKRGNEQQLVVLEQE